MPRSRTPVVRRGDARPAVIIILVALAVFTLLGLILAATLLIGLRRSNTNPATPSPKPVAERFGGLLGYCPPDTIALTAIDVNALTADPQSKELIDAMLVNWNRAHGKRFSQVALSVADVEAYVSARSVGNPEEEKDLPPTAQRGTLTVIRFRRPVDDGVVFQGIIAKEFQLEDRVAPGGGRYHELFKLVNVGLIKRVERVPDVSLWFPDDRTLVIATTRREMELAMRRTPGLVTLRGPMRIVVEKADGHGLDAALATAGQYQPFEPGYFAHRVGSVRVRDKPQSSAVGFTVAGEDIRYSEELLMSDAARAGAARDALNDAFANGQSRVAKSPPGPAKKPGPHATIRQQVNEAAREYLSTAQVGGSDTHVIVTATFRRSTFAGAIKEGLDAGGVPGMPGPPADPPGKPR